MAAPLIVEQSREIPVEVERAFAGTLAVPLATVFNRWYGPIPPIKEVCDQAGEWADVGQTRTINLTGGGSMREELTVVDAPKAFGYRMSDIKGPMSLMIGGVRGDWLFAETVGGATVTWRWTITPRSALAAPAMPVFGWLWRGYARRGLQELEHLLAS